MDSEILTFLLKHGHLDMQERFKRNIWPHPPLKFNDLVNHLAKVLQSENWFPHFWRPEEKGESIYEGIIIERKSPFLYICHVQRHSPINPFLLAERTAKTFFFSKSAARFYLKYDLCLPGDLDGWQVIS